MTKWIYSHFKKIGSFSSSAVKSNRRNNEIKCNRYQIYSFLNDSFKTEMINWNKI